MARLAHRKRERGAVHLEFLLAFFPLLLLFLLLCQLALIAAAEAVVRHSAYTAARSAVVVLEDAPEKFDDVARGNLSSGSASRVKGIEEVMAKLGIGRAVVAHRQSAPATRADSRGTQAGARMVPIRTAAYLPLMPLSPNQGQGRPQRDSVVRALAATSERQLAYALEYTKAAAVVTLHDSADSEELAAEPVVATSPVTARVTYLFYCGVPLVRTLMCRALDRLRQEDQFSDDAIQRLRAIIAPDARFKMLTATATLPNQGAAYYPRGAE